MATDSPMVEELNNILFFIFISFFLHLPIPITRLFIFSSHLLCSIFHTLIHFFLFSARFFPFWYPNGQDWKPLREQTKKQEQSPNFSFRSIEFFKFWNTLVLATKYFMMYFCSPISVWESLKLGKGGKTNFWNHPLLKFY